MAEDFSQVIETQLNELRSAKSADDVIRILSPDRNPLGSRPSKGIVGVFAGNGDEGCMEDALFTAGWEMAWREGPDSVCMRAPDESAITYLDGNVFVGNHAPRTQPGI